MALGRRGAAIQADSANARAIQQAVTRTVETLGGLDILVNNAGIARGGPLESLSLEDIDALINVNIRGVVIAIQAARRIYPQEGALLISAVASPTASPRRASRSTP